MKVTVLGCGNAFGTGGRLQTSFHVEMGERSFLIDCGATALIGMENAGLDPADVSTIFISHLHGDHFAGLVWWLLHVKYVKPRAVPLVIVGPPGLVDRLEGACRSLYAGAIKDFEELNVRFVELSAGVTSRVDGIAVTPLEVVHPSGAPSYGLRIEANGKVLGFSGDTEWTEVLVQVGRGADLFICECSTVDHPIPSHLNWITLRAHLDEISARLVMLTHMNSPMFAMREELESNKLIFAEDGLVLAI